MENIEKRTINHDIRGQICPATLLIALKEMNTYKEELRNGTVELVFRTSSRDATLTIPDAATNMGYSAIVSKEEGYFVISIEAFGR